MFKYMGVFWLITEFKIHHLCTCILTSMTFGLTERENAHGRQYSVNLSLGCLDWFSHDDSFEIQT